MREAIAFTDNTHIRCGRVDRHFGTRVVTVADLRIEEREEILALYLLEIPGIGRTQTVGPLMAFSATPTTFPTAPPPLGEHTDEIMTGLGFCAADVESVRTHSEARRQEMYTALLGED